MDKWIVKIKQLDLKENDILLLTIGFAVFLVLIASLVFGNLTKQAKTRIKALDSQYQKAYILYKKIKSSNNNKKYFNSNILLLVQKLQKNSNIKNKIISVSSTEAGNAIELKLRHLNLKELIYVLKNLEGYSNIKLKQYVLRKNFSSNKFLDLNVIVVKTQ